MALGSDGILGGLKKKPDNWFNPQNSYSMGSILTLGFLRTPQVILKCSQWWDPPGCIIFDYPSMSNNDLTGHAIPQVNCLRPWAVTSASCLH